MISGSGLRGWPAEAKTRRRAREAGIIQIIITTGSNSRSVAQSWTNAQACNINLSKLGTIILH